MHTPVTQRTFLSVALASALALAFSSAQAADIKARNVKFPIVNAIDHPQGLGAQKFVEVVNQKSGGKIKIKEWHAWRRAAGRCGDAGGDG